MAKLSTDTIKASFLKAGFQPLSCVGSYIYVVNNKTVFVTYQNTEIRCRFLWNNSYVTLDSDHWSEDLFYEYCLSIATTAKILPTDSPKIMNTIIKDLSDLGGIILNVRTGDTSCQIKWKINFRDKQIFSDHELGYYLRSEGKEILEIKDLKKESLCSSSNNPSNSYDNIKKYIESIPEHYQ
jgi:hypothetical protein